jgi:hypothetical protein
MSLIILVGALMSAHWLACYLRKSENAVLLSPAITVIAWSLVMGMLVSNGITVESIWIPFWLCTALSLLISVYRNREIVAFQTLVVPALSTLAILSPYFLRGIANYPGSWFWDGFAYLAAGETFWSHPRNEAPQELELLYSFGRSMANFRFTASVLIAVFRGVLPIGADSQASMGYFLILCVFTFSSSCYYLARVTLPKNLQIVFVVLATVSGPILNLVWANNFDHLLALSIAPALVAFAFEFRFEQKRDAAFAAIGSAATAYIYPEMTALLLLPAFSILVLRIARERPPLSTSAAVFTVVFICSVFPIAGSVYRFMAFQIATTGHELTMRPGNGYFPTLLDIRCFSGSFSGLYSPFLPCAPTVAALFKAGVGLTFIIAVLLGVFKRRDGIAVSAALLVSGAMFFIIHQKYDYAAFKILTSGTHIFVLLAVSAFAGSKRYYIVAGAFAGVTMLAVIGSRVIRFDEMVKVKTISAFSELADVVPPKATVAIKINDPLLFEWSLYYLRHHRTVAITGTLPYFASPPIDGEISTRKLSEASYLLTDTSMDGKLFWSNSLYKLYHFNNMPVAAERN